MNKLKKTKGITLIGLVITVIVLLILAGVSIIMLTGENGILRQAQKAKDETIKAGAREKVQMEVAGSYDETGKINMNKLNENLKNNIQGLTYNEKVISEDNKIKSLPDTVNVDGYDIEIKENGSVEIKEEGSIEEGKAGKRYNKDTDVIIGGVPVTIPGGATISAIAEESESVEKGIVIYVIPEGEEVTNWNADEENVSKNKKEANGIKDVQEKYDQFVWVPVENAIAKDMNNDKVVDEKDIDLMIEEDKYPMAIAKDENNYRGILYDFEEDIGEWKVKISDKSYSETSGYREPAYIENDIDGDESEYNDTNPKITESMLQKEYNSMVKRVKDNKGFWVGRYETSNMKQNNTDDLTNKIKVIRGTTNGISGMNWYRMYAGQKAYKDLVLVESESMTSSMIWGSQWDQIMIWMRKIENEEMLSFYIVNSLTMGNYGTDDDLDGDMDNPAKTGNSEKYKVKNIFDLAGNVFERTLEVSSSSSGRVKRGGGYRLKNDSLCGAMYRNNDNLTSTGMDWGSRVTLY